MKITIKTMIIAFLVGLLSSCVPWPRERAAYTDLCQTNYQFKISGQQTQNIILHTYLYDYASRWSDEPYRQGFFALPYITGPEAKTEFYVQLIAYNEGRLRPSKPHKKGTPAIPIIYDSRQAYITFEDGSRLNARPELFLGDLIYDHPISSLDYAHLSPYDINSDEVHRRIPKLTNNSNYGSVYVIFNTSDFNANSKWTIQLGKITVNGEKIMIPPLEFCYHPTKNWIGIEPLMRP